MSALSLDQRLRVADCVIAILRRRMATALSPELARCPKMLVAHLR